MPPKPNELLNATSTLRFLAVCGTRSVSPTASSGSSRFIVGGTIPSRIDRAQNIASIARLHPVNVQSLTL